MGVSRRTYLGLVGAGALVGVAGCSAQFDAKSARGLTFSRVTVTENDQCEIEVKGHVENTGKETKRPEFTLTFRDSENVKLFSVSAKMGVIQGGGSQRFAVEKENTCIDTQNVETYNVEVTSV